MSSSADNSCRTTNLTARNKHSALAKYLLNFHRLSAQDHASRCNSKQRNQEGNYTNSLGQVICTGKTTQVKTTQDKRFQRSCPVWKIGGGGGNRTRVPGRSKTGIYAHSPLFDLSLSSRLQRTGYLRSAIPVLSHPRTRAHARASPLRFGTLPAPRAGSGSARRAFITQRELDYCLHLVFKLRFFTRPPEPSERHPPQTSTRSKPDRPRISEA